MSTSVTDLLERLYLIQTMLSQSEFYVGTLLIDEIALELRDLEMKITAHLDRERTVGEPYRYPRNDRMDEVFLNQFSGHALKESRDDYQPSEVNAPNQTEYEFVQLVPTRRIQELVASYDDYEHNYQALKRWMSDATVMTIVDPYIYNYHTPTAIYASTDEYVARLIDVLPTHLARLNVFYGPHERTGVREAFTNRAGHRKIKVYQYQTTKIHDRIWLKENRSGRLLGTSFNSLGSKLSFIINIPFGDLPYFMTELLKIVVTSEAKTT